jgi:ATP-binding cassette subfamily F protein 3
VARRRSSKRVVAGRHRLGYGVEVGYFPQQEVHLDERGSVLDCANAMTGLTRPKAQTLLGRFLFSGLEAHEKAVTALSGGERRRLALAVLVASGANFLLLDEPTNHLDLASREALEAALEAFPGTVLLVSHDRALLDALAERTLAIEDGTIRSYEGGWAEYVAGRESRAQVPADPPSKPPKPAPQRGQKEQPDRLAELENQIHVQEETIARLEEKLARDWSNVDTIAAHRRARQELQALLSRWEQLVDEVVS